MKVKSTFGWSELVSGVLFLIFGVLAIANPSYTLGGLVVLFGIAMFVSGIDDIMLYIRLNRRVGFGPMTTLIAGIFNLILCFLLLFNIGAGKWIFSIIFPFWFIFHCLGRLINLNFIKLVGGNLAFWISLIVHVGGVILGVLLIFNHTASLTTLGIIIGMSLILFGISNIFSSFTGLGAKRGADSE